MNPSPRDNFYRCMTLIVDNGNEAAWELLDYYLSKQGTTLKDFIENNQHEIYHLCYNNSRCCRCHHATVNKGRILFQTQLGVLLDTKGSNFPCFLHKHGKPTCSHTLNDNYANPNIATNQLDLTLCRCLLFNFTTILPHGSVERTAFGDLIEMRNMCCHAAKGEISSKDYKAYKAQIEKCLLDLAQVYGKTYDMQLKFKDAEKRPFDESICKELQHTILQFQVLQGVSGLKDHIESSREAEKHTSAEIQKMENSTKRTLQEVKSSKEIVEHTASKVQKLNENMEKTLNAVAASQESVEITSAKLEKKQDTNTEETLQAVEYTTANIEKKLEESSKRTIQAVESSQKSVDHSIANIEKKLEESSERTILAVKSNKILVEHTASKIQKLQENTDKTIIDSSRKAEESTTNKIQKLEERLSKCETSKRSRLIGFTQTEIDGHLKKGTFVETPAVQACIKLLETKSLLILTGAAGTGKSRNSLEILHQFRIKHPEYNPVKLTDLHDFTDLVPDEETLVVLFEDIFGRTNTKFSENTDVQIIDRLHACTIKGNIKVVLTVRDTIRMSCEWILNSHTIFHVKCEVDLSSEKFKMTKTEKESLLLKYFGANNFRLLDFNDPENYNKEAILDPQITVTVNRVTLHNIVESEPLLGFPEACSLFTGNRKLTRLGLSFFKHPSKYLYEEIEKLRKNGKDSQQDRMSYVVLVYILLNEDVLDPDDIELNICFDILKSCYGISNKELPPCHIIDAANDMIGRYLIFHSDDGTYHLQHQTIFESILISYSRIDPGLILSRLSFDFIREMVRLQNYTVREGEIVMKISTKYYSMLANRIVEIILSEYFSKSLSLNFQLLCESEIIRQNDECFMKSLIEKVHDAYFQPDYDLQTFVTYRGVCKLCKLYLPAILLERITHQNKMNDSITLLVDHIALMLNSKSEEEDIEFVCKSSLLDAFLNVCDLENNENILDNMWVSVRSLDMSEMTEYIRSSINRVCSRCPMTTMRWMLHNIDQRVFDMNQLMKRACEFKRLDIVQFLCETINHNQLDFTSAFVAAINNVWNDTDESVSKWLINNIDLQLFDMKQITSEVLEAGCEKDLQFLLQHVDNCMLDIKAVFNKLYKKGRRSIESLLKWIGTNVEKEKINTLEMSNQVCLTKDSEVVKYLIKNIDLGPLDVMSVLLSSMNSYWQGDNKDLIQWICLNVDLKQINIVKIIDKACEEERYDELKILLKNIKENHNTVLRNACKKTQLELIKILLSVADHDKLNMREAVRSVCVVEKMELLEFFLYNVDHRLYEAHHVLKKSCRYGWTHIVKWLMDNIEYSALDINTAMNTVLHREFMGPDNTLVRLFLQYPIHDKVDVAEIIKECCWWGLLDLVQLICEKNDPKQLNIKEAMNAACSRSQFELVEWMLSNIENNLFDMPTAFDKAIHADFDDLNASLIFLLKDYTDHKLIDMTHLLMIGCKQCWYDIVNWVLGNTDHTVLDVDKAMNSVYIKWMFDEPYNDDIKINCRRVKYEPLIKMILEKVNHSLLDLKKVFNQACHYASLDVVILVLENTDHKKIDVKKALDILYISWMYNETFDELRINERRDKYEPLIKLMVEKVNFDSLDLKKVLNQACKYGSFDVVKLVLENTDHERLDVNEAMKKAYDSWMYSDKKCIDGSKRYEPVIKLILDKVNHESLDMTIALNLSCRYGLLDFVTVILQNTDHKMLDIKRATNILYDAWEQNYSYSTIEETENRRDQYEKLIKLIIEKVKHDSLDFHILLNLACCCCSLGVVTLMLEKTDHKMLDVKEAMNIICDYSFDNQYCYEDEQSRFRSDKYEQLIKLILNKVNHDCFDLQQVLERACFNCSLGVVTLLLENTDHKMLDVKEAMNIICDKMVSINLPYHDDDEELSDRRDKYEQLIKLILDKVNDDSLDLQQVLDCACRYCSLDIVTLLFEKTDHKMLDVQKAIDIICDKWASVNKRYHYDDEEKSDRRDKYEQLINLILVKGNHDSLDLQQVLNCACRYCSLDIVTLLFEKTDQKMLDVKEVMNIICDEWNSYHDEENWHRRDKHERIIKLILEKVNRGSLDLQNVLNYACRWASLDVVTLLLENTDHKMLDVKKAMNTMCDHCYIDYNYYEDDEEYSYRGDEHGRMIKLIFDKVNHDSLDLQIVLNLACSYALLDIVTLLLENTYHKMLDVKRATNLLYYAVKKLYSYSTIEEIKDKRDQYEKLLKLILEKVNHDSLDLQQVLNCACSCCSLDVVTLLFEITDHKLLDVKNAMEILGDMMYYFMYDEGKSELTKRSKSVVKLFLEKVSHSLLDLPDILKQECRKGSLDMITLLFENTDHKKLDVNAAMNVVNCHIVIMGDRNKAKDMIKLFLENVNHSLFDINDVLNKTWYDRLPDTVMWLLMNYDHALFDLKDVMRKACESGESRIITYLVENCDNTLLDITGAITRVLENNILNDSNKEIIKYLFRKVNKDLIDDKMLQVVPYKLALPFIVTLCFKLFDNSTQGVSKVILHKSSMEHGYMSMVRSNGGLTLIQKLVTDINSENFDIKDIMNKACSFGCFDTVTWLLDNEDHSRFDLKMAMCNTFNSSCLCKEELMQLLLQKCVVDELDMEINMNEACKQGMLKIVTWLIENIDHRLFDLNTAISHLFHHFTDRNQDIFKLLIANVSYKLFDFGIVIEQAFRLDRTEILIWLLQAKYHSLLDVKYVMNEACRVGNLQIIKHVCGTMGKEYFDSRSAMNKACRSSKTNSVRVVKWLWENLQHTTVDMESAMNNACRYDNIAVVEWLWTNLERKLFNVKNAWNNACYNCNKKLLSYLLKNMEVNMLDKSKALVHACRNYREGDQIISLLFKTPNMISPENCKIVFKEACVQCNIKVVKWLLAHTDFKPLEYKDTLIDTIKATTNKSNKKDKTDHKNLVCFMVNHRMIKKLDRHELSVVVEALSSIGKLDMVKQLWYKTANNMFNMRDIVNTACKSGKLEIVDWLLQKIALENLDVQTVMVESCGYGWLKIVKLLLLKCEMKILDISTAMDEACSYGRYDVVNFLLKNVDIKTFNTKLVLEKASGYGWKDIINWSFDNSNDTSFDLNECMLEAFLQGRLEIIEIFFSKYDAKQFDVDILVDKSCSNCGNAGVMKFLIENFELKQKHLDIIIKSACKYSWTEIVSSILDRCKHDKNIMEEAMKNVCNSGENEIVEIFLDKIDISFLGVKTNMVIPCQKGWDEIVSLLLERVDHSLFDLTVAMNEACRCGEADIVELLIQKVNHKHFNFDTAIEEACKSHLNENLVLTLLKYINCSTSDRDGMSKKAREYGWRKVGSRLKRMSYNEN